MYPKWIHLNLLVFRILIACIYIVLLFMQDCYVSGRQHIDLCDIFDNALSQLKLCWNFLLCLYARHSESKFLEKIGNNIGEHMNKKSKLILASAVFIAALMLLVPLSQANVPGGGGTGKSQLRSNCFEWINNWANFWLLCFFY